ncbi:hypothetical protein LshimejAT787_0104610 [Lyophyllum shimeji]|uniref:Chromo domain-containing protein n=1 Tax=Lyophyllum shimeji TaxID=47721 RepID=A0A9P3PCZ7_LYOSH|nr:hypothetical protein LshimejAT787_0104610 [Lyophyllum shimeji]
MGNSKKKEDSQEETFHVEVIEKARVAAVPSDEDYEDDVETKKKGKKKGKGKAKADKPAARWEYYVKWANYSRKHNTWEPEGNVAGCQRLLASFWEEIGTDNADYFIGYEVAASKEWIRREKDYFAREYEAEGLQAKARAEEAKRQKASAKRKRKSASAEVAGVSASKKSKSRTTSLALSDSDSDSDDDIPLIAKQKLGKKAESSDDLPARKKLKTETSISVATDPGRSKPKETPVAGQHELAASIFSEPLPAPAVGSQIPRPLPPPPPPKSRPSSAKPSPTVPASIPWRPSNPHAKLVVMESENIASGSGISTKQRLAQGALAPTRPNAIPLPAPKQKVPPPPLRINSGGMMNLSFKKKPPATPVLGLGGSFATEDNRSTLATQSPVADQEPTLAALNARLSPVPQEDYIMHGLEDEPLYPGPPAVTERPSPARPHVAPELSAAERFLQTFMPPALAAPLIPAVEQPFEPQPPRPLVPKKLPPPTPKIPKRWTWSGGVFSEAKPSEPIFHATFSDATEPVQGGMRFSIALATMDRLYLPSFHDAADLDSILPACKGPHQFARLGPKENDDVQPLQIFSTYMSKMQKIILLPISLDNTVIAHIILFHHSTTLATRRFRPPMVLQRAGTLVAALVPWDLMSGQLTKHSRKPPNTYLPVNADLDEAMISDEIRWTRSIRTKSTYHHALRILKFPKWLHDYLLAEGRERTFWVWWEGGDGTKKKAGMETHLLHAIMEQCRARKVRQNLAEARIVFVHVGALRTLFKRQGVLEIIAGCPHIQFYTYGTHETVPPEYWGVREIYPCGGIVTFTPKAILDDPIGVLHRISQIHSHPLWECYILPSALGMVAKLHLQTGNDDPLALCDREPFAGLLDAIENGELSLLTSPPPYELSPTRTNDPRQGWLRKHWSHRPHGPLSVLQSCIDVFNSSYANIQQVQWPATIHASISEDLANMRCQPIFMQHYRRYVVLESPQERRVPVPDGLEWTTTAKFDFKDDFFPRQE